MTAWHVVQRSLAYLTCSAVIPCRRLGLGLFFGDGNDTFSFSYVLSADAGSSKALPKSLTRASTTSCLFFLSGWNKGQDASASVVPVTAALNLAASTEYASIRSLNDASADTILVTVLSRYFRSASGSEGSGVVSRWHASLSSSKGSKTCEVFLRMDLGGGGEREPLAREGGLDDKESVKVWYW